MCIPLDRLLMLLLLLCLAKQRVLACVYNESAADTRVAVFPSLAVHSHAIIYYTHSERGVVSREDRTVCNICARERTSERARSVARLLHCSTAGASQSRRRQSRLVPSPSRYTHRRRCRRRLSCANASEREREKFRHSLYLARGPARAAAARPRRLRASERQRRARRVRLCETREMEDI